MWCLLALWLVLTGPAFAQDEDVDPVALAALLISDGHWNRAAVTLAGVDTQAKDLDLVRYHALVGLVALHDERWTEAVTAFEASIAAGQADPMVYVQLAQARLGAGDPQGALDAANQSGEVGEVIAGVWLLKARANKELGNLDAAYALLLEGQRRFPEANEVGLHQVLLLTELGLFQEAMERGRTYLGNIGDDPEAWVLVAEAIRKGGDADGAITLMEEARVRFPTEVDVLVQLAGTWVERDNPLACGVLLQEASELDGAYAVESAECYRRAGEIHRALYMNSMVADPTEKARQRLGLLLEAQRFDHALSLEYRLRRLGLHEDDKTAYALAYARFQLGDYDEADAWLDRISDPGLFQHATQLRSIMEGCRAEPETCR